MTTILTRRAYGYFRVSSQDQAGERHVSLEAQAHAFQSYCKSAGLQSATTFSDVASGRRDDRVEYHKMLSRLELGDVVVVMFLDRFGRNPREILRRYWELEEKGVQVVSVNEDLKEELLLLIRAGMAGAESRRIGERTQYAKTQAALRGQHMAKAPFGYRRVREGDKTCWEIDPAAATILREMYRMAVEENVGYKTIADRLNAAGYRSRSGKPFASYTLQVILNNPALMGTLVYNRRRRTDIPSPLVEKSGVFPAILSPDEWQKLQRRIAVRREHSRGKTHSSLYLLSGMVRCGHCGGPMIGKVGARKVRGEGRYRNYYCSRAIKSKALCAVYNGHSTPKLEKAILEYLGQFSDPAKVKEYLSASEGKQVARHEAELGRVAARLKELQTGLLNDLERLDRGTITEGEFTIRSQSRRQETATLEKRKEELQATVTQARRAEAVVRQVPVLIGSFFEDFSNLDVRQQKAQLQTILKAAHVWREGKIELEFRE